MVQIIKFQFQSRNTTHIQTEIWTLNWNKQFTKVEFQIANVYMKSSIKSQYWGNANF